MAIEIVPKPTPKSSLSTGLLFYFSFLALLAAVSVYFVFFSLTKNDSKRIQDIGVQIANARTPEEISMEKDIKEKKKKIDDFSRLFRVRKFPTKFFGFSDGPFFETKKFASLIHPKVRLFNFSLDVKNSKVNISGLTESYTTLEQQMMIFQKEPLVKETNLSSFSADKDGKINFSFDLSLDPAIFK